MSAHSLVITHSIHFTLSVDRHWSLFQLETSVTNAKDIFCMSFDNTHMYESGI